MAAGGNSSSGSGHGAGPNKGGGPAQGQNTAKGGGSGPAVPSAHPVTGTALPKGTGAGQGRVTRGRR